MKKSAYFQTPTEFIEEINSKSYYKEDRKELLNKAYEQGFDIYQLKLLADICFDIYQAGQIYDGFINNLTMEQVRTYANPDLYWKQMQIIKDAYLSHMSPDKLELLLDDNLDYAQIKEINQGIKDNLPISKLLEFSNPNMNWKEMNYKRNSFSKRGDKMKRLVSSISPKDPYELYKSDLNYHDDGNDSPMTPGVHVEDPSMKDFIKGYKLDPYEMRYWAKVAKADKNPKRLMKISWKEVDVLQFTPEYLADKILKLWNQMDGTLQNAFEGFTLRYDNKLKKAIADEINKRGYTVYPILLVDAPMYAGVHPTFAKVNKARVLLNKLNKALPTIGTVHLANDLQYIIKKDHLIDIDRTTDLLLDYYSQLFPQDYSLQLVNKQYFKPFVDLQISDESLEQMEKMDSENQKSLVLKDGGVDGYDFTSDMRFDTTAPNVYEVNNGTNTVYKLSNRLKKKITADDENPFEEDADAENEDEPVPTFSMPDIDNSNEEEEIPEEEEIEFDPNNRIPNELIFDVLNIATREIVDFTGQKMLKPPAPVAIYIREDNSIDPDSYSQESQVSVVDYLDKIYNVYQCFLSDRSNVFIILQANRYTMDYKHYEWDNIQYKGFYKTKQEAVNYIKAYL